MSIKILFFPEQSRSFYAKRWLDIILRTIHLIGLLGVSGGILFFIEQSLWLPYFLMTVLSGLAMTILSLWSNGKWLLQNCGLAIILKIVLLILIPVFPDNSQYLLFIIIIISAISSHAPARFRYYSPILGRKI
ncbi:MAG: hypothetical protein KZQ83_11340 [gamma proteobacterium symbiont of Taylorina sp.]|nr:hypothetical protein [gamma proteobacterium symbiont of Taylorina sp.]